MSLSRSTAVVLALGLIATACSSAGNVAPSTSAEPTIDSRSEPTSADGEGGSPTASSDVVDATTATFTQGDLDAIAEARQALSTRVGQATAPWPTNWALSNIDLGELDLGISRVDPRDTIPPIDQPQFESVEAAGNWLADGEPGALV